MKRFLLCLFVVLFALSAEAYRFAPAGTPVNLAMQLQLLHQEVSTGAIGEAAARYDALLAEFGGEITTTAPETLVNVGQVLRSLPSDMLRKIAPEYEKRFGPAAAALLERRLAQADAQPGDFYAVARRYPLTRSAGAALAHAARRAIDGGDLVGAQAYLELAAARQALGEPDAALLDRLRKAATPQPAPAAWIGPAATDSRWYGATDSVSIARHIPVAAGGVTYFSGARQVIAVRDSGAVAWSYTTPKPWSDRLDLSRPGDMGRGIVFQPALLLDAAGAAQTVVVRMPEAQSGESCLRALRASDGKVLWTTEGRGDRLAGLIIAGNPAVAGRNVYFLAIESNENGMSLLLVALDVTSGNMLFITTLGTFSDTPRVNKGRVVRGQETNVLSQFWQLDAPTISGEMVYVTPNVGQVMAVNRFDGRVEFARPYPRPATLVRFDDWRRYRDLRARNQPAKSPLSDGQMLRYTNAPVVAGGVLVCAPQDSGSVFAVDARNGALVWQRDAFEQHTLIGTAGGFAIFAGTTIAAIDAADGSEKWVYRPRQGTLAGPPAIGAVIASPERGGLMAVNPATGNPAPIATIPYARRLLATGAAKAALAGTDIGSALAPGGGAQPATKAGTPGAE